MVDYRDIIKKDIYKVYRNFKKTNGREPEIQELIHNLIQYMNSWELERLYLLVEFQHKTTAEAAKEFHKLLRERKKEIAIKNKSMATKGKKLIPTNKRRPLLNSKSSSIIYPELHRYLMVYDYHKKGLTIPKIANEIQKKFLRLRSLMMMRLIMIPVMFNVRLKGTYKNRKK